MIASTGIAQALLAQISLADQRLNHRLNLALGHRAQPAVCGQLLMVVFPDLGRVAAGDQVGQLAAAEAAVQPGGPGEQDADGFLRLVIDRRGLGSLAVIAAAAALGQRLGIAEIVHDRLLPAAGAVGIAAHQIELVLADALPLVAASPAAPTRPTGG